MNPQVPVELQNAIELYKKYYVDYRASGKPESKIAYQNAELYIQQYLQQTNQQVAKNAGDITTFINEYASSNPELVNLQKQFGKIRTEGPKLEDQYIQIKRAKSEVPEQDMTAYYVKGAIAVGLLGIVAVISLF